MRPNQNDDVRVTQQVTCTGVIHVFAVRRSDFQTTPTSRRSHGRRRTVACCDWLPAVAAAAGAPPRKHTFSAHELGGGARGGRHLQCHDDVLPGRTRAAAAAAAAAAGMTMTSHLVCLFCVTAGQNGENLGSDEEQIVSFVYLLYDISNNKVSYGTAYSLLRLSVHCNLQ